MNEGATAENLALSYGLSLSAIRLILRQNNVKKIDKTPEQKARALIEKKTANKSLSPVHTKVGTRLAHFRMFTFVADRALVAKKLGWSIQKVASVEQGIYNLTLLDMMDLSTLFKEPLNEFVRPIIEAPTGPIQLENTNDD
jgi:hypothetical protein